MVKTLTDKPDTIRAENAIRYLGEVAHLSEARVGDVVLYEGNRMQRNSEAVITKPRELANLFREVISTKAQGWIRGGMLRQTDLYRHIWQLSEANEREGHISLEILKQVELVMAHAHNSSLLLLPSLLPADKPPILKQYWNQTKGMDGYLRVFEPPSVLKGLAGRLIYRCYHLRKLNA